MDKLVARIARQPRWQILMVCLMITLLVGGLDYATQDVSLIILYILPIYLAVWILGIKIGLSIALLCGVESFIVNRLITSSAIPILSIRTWNSLIDTTILVFSGYIFAMLKNELIQKEKRSEMLEVANEALDAYNRMVSHDLRQPLNIISTSCQTIEMLCGDVLDEECRSYLQIAHDNVLRMNDLIEVLLQFSRLTQGDLLRETVDLSGIAKDIARNVSLCEPERRVRFNITEGLTANCDPKLLRGVLENLIGNAWKYTATREEAIIDFDVTEIDREPAYFVRDNGKGFDMADVDKLFRPFKRLPGAEEFGGFGIGLATVDRIVRRHGGRIWAEGKPDKGATFYFTLPTG